MIPERIGGWWLASVAGTAAVMVLSPPVPGDRLRPASAKVADALADVIDACPGGPSGAGVRRARDRGQARAAGGTSPQLRTGRSVRARPDEAMSNAIDLLEWCTSLVSDMVRERADLSGAAKPEREMSRASAEALRGVSGLMDRRATEIDLDVLARARDRSDSRLQALSAGRPGDAAEERVLFNADMIALTTLAIGADTRVASRLARAGVARTQPRSRRWWASRPLDVPGTAWPPSAAWPSATRASLGVDDQQPPRRARDRGRRGGGRRDERPAWLLGRARDAFGPAQQRRGDRCDRVPGAARDGDRVRRRRGPAGGDRLRHHRPLDRPAGGGVRRRLRSRHGAVRGRPGGLHGHRGGAVQPARAGRLEGRGGADRGRRPRLRGQRSRRAAVLAPRPRVGGRGRPRRLLPSGRPLPRTGGRWVAGAQDEMAGGAAAAAAAATRLDGALRGFLAEQGTSSSSCRSSGAWSAPGCACA